MNFEYNSKDEIKSFSVNERYENGINLYDISIDFGKKIKPNELTVKFFIPMTDADGIWSPLNSWNTEIVPRWNPRGANSKISRGMPVFCAYNAGGENRFTVALSELKADIGLTAGLVEETCECEVVVKFFKTVSNPIERYSCTVYVDFRKLPFYTAVKDVKHWWETYVGAKPCAVPYDATCPIYSTWYNFHQKLDAKTLQEELKIAKDMGFHTIIVDDGWQCDDNNRGYAFAGDWKPAAAKIGDAKTFVDSLHKIGIKVIFWYSVPFIGYETENFEKFKGKYLSMDNGARCAILDPRFKDVREFLIGVYVNAVKEYGLDGLKLDFIDSFSLSQSSPANYEDMDIPVLEEAVYRLMYDVYQEVTKINPNVMVEFRQQYVGPLICAFGNMLRVYDCPYSGRTNARASIDLRLTSGNTPVHTDMTMWHKNTTKEDVARQLILGLFAVPQISVKLSEISPEHHQVVKEYLKYWNENKDLLLSESFYCSAPRNSYAFAGVKGDNREIVMLMATSCLRVEKDKTDIFNVTGNTDLYIDISQPLETCIIRVFDCLGKEISSSIAAGGQIIKVYAPHSSKITVEKA